MIPLSELRRVECKIETPDGIIYEQASFGQLEKGDVFRMFEPDGTLVVDTDTGFSHWYVTDSSFMIGLPVE